MSISSSPVFQERPVVILNLPLAANTVMLHPEQLMVKVGNSIHDVGAFCYYQRSDEHRKYKSARKVVIDSLCKDRVEQIRLLIQTFSNFLAEDGRRQRSVEGDLASFKQFIDWADTNTHHDCLLGGDATRTAFRHFARSVEERFQRHEIENGQGSRTQRNVLRILEAATGMVELDRGVRLIKKTRGGHGGTEPANDQDFAHLLALNNSIFSGLCDLLLSNQPYPFKLNMPKSLGWEQNYLWLFPTNKWFLAPHQWGLEREKIKGPYWPYDYKKGRLATIEEISSRYSGNEIVRRNAAVNIIRNTTKNIILANADSQFYYRRLLAKYAHNAFFFLFIANTGVNISVVTEIETNGILDDTQVNQGFRSIKWRAQGKEINLIMPLEFMPALRRYLELRRYLLNGRDFPYLFLNMGNGKQNTLSKVSHTILKDQYTSLKAIDPKLPRIAAQKIRATVSIFYKRKYGPAIESAVMQHTESSAQKYYDAGTEADQHNEIGSLLEKIADKASQRVVQNGSSIANAKPLEEGGVCSSYGNPESFSPDSIAVPDCMIGCLFCAKRILVANEEDIRKIASTAYLMEQLISGVESEKEFRPKIIRCDEDLAKIRTFKGCEDMVDRIKIDVYENGNLTPYIADKVQLFLALGFL